MIIQRHAEAVLAHLCHRVEEKMTIREAADYLNISYAYMLKLLGEGLKLDGIIEYKLKRDAERRNKLDELIAMTEKMGGYAELK